MSNQQVCLPIISFSLLIISLILSIVWGLYQMVRFQNESSNQSSTSPAPIINYQPPPITPDQADDLALGELPPRRRDYRKINDPLKEPSRRYTAYPSGVVPGGNINIPTQGYLPSYQLMGYLRPISQRGKNIDKKTEDSDDRPGNPERMLKLFGRRIDTHRYQYYTTHHDDPTLKIPLELRGDKELFDDDELQVPGYPGKYQVTLYDLEAPKYLPNLI